MTEISDDKADERKIRIIIIIHKRQNKNIKVCRQNWADLNNTQKTEQKHKRSADKVGQTLIIIHKRQNKNIKVCRQSRADLNDQSLAGRTRKAIAEG